MDGLERRLIYYIYYIIALRIRVSPSRALAGRRVERHLLQQAFPLVINKESNGKGHTRTYIALICRR